MRSSYTYFDGDVKAYNWRQTIHTDTVYIQSVIAKFAPTLEVSIKNGLYSDCLLHRGSSKNNN